MPAALNRNSVIVFGLALLFSWSFMFAKHDPALRGVIPFGEDPYDAVGSFAFIIGMLIALVSLVRAFRPYRDEPSRAQRVYLVRSQVAVALAVLITLASDAVAMARHPAMWGASASRNRLVGLLLGIAVAGGTVLSVICMPQEKLRDGDPNRWTRAAISSLLALLVLALYPEQLINGTATHLLTVVAGAVVLFAPMRPLLTALVPYESERSETPAHRGFSGVRRRWGFVLLLGIVVGVCVFAGEMSESGGSMPLGRLAFVASVFIGLAIAGLLVAYAFLGKVLGLGTRD